MNARKIILIVVLTVLAASCSLWMGHRSGMSKYLETLDGQVLPCRVTDPPLAMVRWVETADASDREALAAGCATVGPAVVREFAGADSVPVLDSLIVVTWNVHVGGGDVPGFVRRLREGEFTDHRRPEHFIIFLQEAFREGLEVPLGAPGDLIPARIVKTPPEGERIDVIETARALGLDLFYVPSMKNGVPDDGEPEEDRGSAILSTFPLDSLTAIELPLERFRRVAIAATARGRSSLGDPWTLRLCNVHLATRTGFPRVIESMGIGRLRQARALVPVLPEKDVVLGGDINTWGPGTIEGAVDYFKESFPQTPEVDDQPTLSVAVLPDRRTDYIFYRLSGGKTGRCHRLDDRMGSDHYPLIGVVQLKNPEHERSPN